MLEIVRVEFRTNEQADWIKHDCPWCARPEADKLVEKEKESDVEYGIKWEYRIVPLSDDEKIEIAMKMREQLFEIANSFGGERTGVVAMQLHTACNYIHRAKERLEYCPSPNNVFDPDNPVDCRGQKLNTDIEASSLFHEFVKGAEEDKNLK
jgi:hypothetical protein